LDNRRTKGINIQTVLGNKMLNATTDLGRAGGILTAQHHLVRKPRKWSSTCRALARKCIRLTALFPALKQDPHNRWNDFTSLLHLNPISFPNVLSRNFIRIVKRRPGYGGSCEQDRF